MAKEQVDESVIAANFRNEVGGIVSNLKELRGRNQKEYVGGDPSREVGHFGILHQKLYQVIRRIREKLSFSVALDLLVSFGKALYELEELSASKSFYTNALSCFEQGSLPSVLDREIHIRALYASALCTVQQMKLIDKNVSLPSTLSRLIEALNSVHKAVSTAIALAVNPAVQSDTSLHMKYVAHVWNGTIHLMGICSPLQALGFEANVLPYMKLCVLALDKIVQLCTTAHCSWRVHIYLSIAACYDALARKHFSKRDSLWSCALSTLDAALARVMQLKKEEELDAPVPEVAKQILTKAEEDIVRARFFLRKLAKPINSASQTHSSKTASPPPTASSHLTLSVTKEEIESTFSRPKSRVLAVIHVLNNLITSTAKLDLLPDFGEKSVACVNPSDIDGILLSIQPYMSDETVIQVEDQVTLLKILFRYRKWSMFEACYASAKLNCEAQSQVVAQEELKLIFSLYELLHDRTDQARLNGVISLLRLAHRKRHLCHMMHDTLSEVMLYMWYEFAKPALEILDKNLSSNADEDVDLRKQSSRILLTLHLLSDALHFDDITWRSIVSLRLAILIKADQPRLAIQILRSMLEVLCTLRDSIAGSNLQVASTVDDGRAIKEAAFSGCFLSSLEKSKDLLVPFPGAQFQQTCMNMTLASIQTDMTYLLYDLEYLLVSSIDGIGPKMITTRLATECNRNGYTKCILNLRTAIHGSKNKEDQRKLFLEAMATLDDMKHHDELLLTYVPEKYSTLKCERPSAPAIISRGTTFVTLEVLQYYNEKAKVAYYCVYGKETGAGTDVSLNNMEYPGTGSIIFPSPQPLLATISGLQPNESYVFAVAAFDANDQVIGGIGATSLPVVTLNPLMLHFCYGILAKEAFISGERSLATKAANVIYSDYVTSACFKIDRWRLNPLYTHALKFQKLDSKMISNQYTQSPMQTLHMFFSAILILIAAGSESYDVDNLVRIKNEPRNVLPDQIQVIETVNKGMIALEIACLTEQANYICTISHKLYNLMVPLLLLKSSNGLLLQPLCSIIEALLIVPREQWDENIYRTYICASFEILKIASEKSESIAVKQCLMPDSPSSHFNQVILHPFRTHCKQASGLREVVFIRHKWITGYDGQHGTDCAPEGEKPKKTTPRDDKAGAQSRCDEVLISNTSPAKAFVELKTHFSDHKDFVKFACLLLDLQIRSGEKIPKGVLKEVCWQPSLRLSSRAIEVLVQLGASQLYQRENENIAGQIIENIEQTSQSSEGSSRLKEIDVQDMDVYLWSGEVYFLSGYSLHLSLSTKHEENVFGGPDQDLSWFYLASSTHRSPEAIQMEAQPAVNEIFLDMAKASQLFFHAQAWVKLQSCMECVWNTLWKAWIFPLCFEKMYDWKSLYICTMRAVDMLDILKNERSYDDVDIMKRSTDSVDSGPHLLMTSTDVAAKEPSIGISWIAKVVSYTLQALCAVGEWKHLVLLGKRAHFLTGGEFGDCFLPWVVFAQTQRCELQDTVVENSKYELATYVKEYEESQLKKKKKKSRLVIHEVVTEEERHYLEERSRMEVELNKMAEHQKVLKDHLSHLMSLMDHSVRAKSMCLQSLHRAQKSVAKSLTYQESSVDILTHFKSCVSLCRQKRSTILLVQTLQEMGDYYFAESDISAAKRTWNDGIDAVFGSLTAATHWRDLINDLVVDGDGTWCALMCYNMLGKLIWTSLHEDLNQRLENALLGSAILCKLFSGSLSHPNPEQQWSFAEYTIRTDIVLFSHRPLRYIHPANVMLASTAMIETLLSNEQYIHALPLATCMDYFASCHFLDARGSIQAKRMKAEACIGIGRMDCVCTLLNEILNIELVLHQSKRIGDPENEALHKWLLEFSVSKTISEFKFGSRLACLLCLTILRWIFTLGCNENSSPQGIALKHIAAQAAIQLQAMVQQENNSNIASEEYGGGNDKPTPRAPDTEKTNAIPRENPDQVQTQDKLKIECECDIILSALSLEDGLTDSAREALQSAMQKCKQTVKPKLQEVHFDNVICELDVLFWLKCRIQLIKCELVQGHHEGALRLCNISLLEANKSNERTYSRKIDALRVQALLLSGKRFEAENEGSKWLENDDPNTLTSTRVEMLLLLSQMKKTNMSSSHHHLQCLNLSLTYLKQAMDTINSITQQNGWIGVYFSSHSHESLINVYHPNLALYITTVCHLVTNLLQLYDINGSVEPLEKTLVRIEDGLRVLTHVSNPPSWMKAQLQFLKGCIIRRCGSNTTESIPYFLESLQICLKDGGHPRKLMHQACMELVQVYGTTDQLNDHEKQAQIQAAFHYLQLACKLQEQLYLLWNSTQLHFVSATSLDKLSAFLQQEIISIARSMSNDSTLEHLGHLVLPHFISQLREEDIIFDQSLSCSIKRSVTSLHSFLSQNHSQYSKQCYTVLPPIPKGDPEIPGGLICVQWVKTSLSEITMYFAFGAAVNETDSRLNATPILSRREGLSLTGVQELRHDAARIRQLLQDKGENPEHIRVELTKLLEAIQLFYHNVDSNVRAARVRTPIPCTILEVSLLERIFDIQHGIFAVHGELCCHLRNVLAEHSPDHL